MEEIEHFQEWVKIGDIGRPHGVRGAFFVGSRGDELGFSLKGLGLRLGSDPTSSNESQKVLSQKTSGGRTVLELESLKSRNEIESLKGKSLWVSRNDVPVDDDSEYLWNDLIGLSVLDEVGVVLGKIVEVSNFGASDLVTIHGERGTLDIPFVSSYVSMDSHFENGVTLSVSASVFDDCWETL